MKREVVFVGLALWNLASCREEKQVKTGEPSAAQTYLEQCVQALEFARSPRTQQIAAGVTSCESVALGDLALKKPDGVRSSEVKLDTSRLTFSAAVVDSRGKTLSSETDPTSYNRIVIQRKAVQVAMGRAAQNYVLECYKAVYALFADKYQLAELPKSLNTCESSALGPYALRRPDVVRSSAVGPLDPAKPADLDNLGVEVTLQSGQIYFWDGRTASLKP